MRVTATEGVISLMATEIRLIAEDGSFIKIGGGITMGTNDEIRHHARAFPFTGPVVMQTELPTFDKGAPDQKFVLKYGLHTENEMIAPNRDFEIEMSDGSVVKGTSDAEGKTELLARDAMHMADIRILSAK